MYIYQDYFQSISIENVGFLVPFKIPINLVWSIITQFGRVRLFKPCYVKLCSNTVKPALGQTTFPNEQEYSQMADKRDRKECCSWLISSSILIVRYKKRKHRSVHFRFSFELCKTLNDWSLGRRFALILSLDLGLSVKTSSLLSVLCDRSRWLHLSNTWFSSCI